MEVHENARSPVGQVASKAQVIPFSRITSQQRHAGVPCAPIIEMRIAAGNFSNSQALDELASEWVALPDWIQPQPNLFIAKVVGESMNRRIPNGSWCLFRAQPGGSRQGKIVVVQHREINDPETGGRFTLKLYFSEIQIAEDGEWRHHRIVLVPDSDQDQFKPIELDVETDEYSYAVVAEFLMVVPVAS